MTTEEAINVIRVNYRNVSTGGSELETALRQLIPELAESEDEKIRKAIIKALYSHTNSINVLSSEGYSMDDVLAWVEKQKEQKPSINIGQLKSMMLQYLQEASNEEDDSEIEADTDKWAKKILEYDFDLSKFDADVEFDAREPRDNWEYIKEFCDKFGRIPKDMDELDVLVSYVMDKKQKEQKPAEWNEDWREEDIQTRFAFYTYKDDPSVLYLSNVFVEEASRNHGFGTRILKAAEKVAETIGATTISLKVKQDSPANAWYRKNGYGYVAFEDGYDWLEKNLEYLKPVKSPEWSEEDIHITNILECIVGKNRPDEIFKIGNKQGISAYKICSWLKNLSERFDLQPKQNWSEEDEEILNTIIADVNRTLHSCGIGTDEWNIRSKAISWLRSFHPQSKEESCNYITPNKEFFQWIYDRLVYVHKENPDVDYMRSFKERINNLSFEDKHHWRPSEEQMEAMKKSLAYWRGTTKEIPSSKLLESLYNALEKLM